MLKYRDFKCKKCEEVIEKLIADDILYILCQCGGTMDRQLCAPQGRGNSAHRYLKPRFNK